MAQAMSNREQLAYIAEVTAGTTPATPTGQLCRYSSVKGMMKTSTVQSAEQTNNSEIADLVRVNVDGGLDIGYELSYDTQFEDFLQSLFANTWATNVLKVGTTRKTFTFERGQLDIAQYQKYTFAQCSKMTFNIGSKKIIEGMASFDTYFPTWSGATAWSATTPAGTNTPMDPINSIQLMQEGGAGALAGVTDFSMTLERQTVGFDQVNNINPLDIQPGVFKATGSFSLYYPDATYFTKYTNFTQTSLAFTLGGAGSKKYAFSFAKVRLADGTQDNPAMNTPLVQKFTWQATKDVTNTTAMITRTP